MKVLDLQCRHGHTFEGWFASQGDYDAQRAKGLVTCPVCNNVDIVKMLSAPRLNLGHGLASQGQGDVNQAIASNSTGANPASHLSGSADQPAALANSAAHGAPDSWHQLQANLLNLARHVMANTEDVGSQFAEEARKIHYGEREECNIRGQATREETEALLDEGIAVMPLSVPENLKGPLQ